MADAQGPGRRGPKRKRGEYTVNRKGFTLTYSCPTEADDNPIPSKNALLDFLVDLGGTINKYIIAEELHKNGTRHYHAMIKYEKAFQSEDSRVFDFKGVHPCDKGTPGKKGGFADYCGKTDNYITNFWKPDVLVYIMKLKTWKEAQDYLRDNAPGMALRSLRTIKGNWMMMKKSTREPEVFYGPYPDYFPDWDRESKCLVLTGEAGTCKTQWARWFCAHNGGYFYFKGGYEQLREYDGSEWLIMDDLKHNLEDCNDLVCVKQGGDLKARWSDIESPICKKIIIANPDMLQLPGNSVAINRRVHNEIWPLKSSDFGLK